MFGQQPGQQDIRREARERYESLESAAARTAARHAELDIRRPKLRESIRHWYCWLTRRKPAER